MAGLLDFFNSTAPDKSGGLLGGFGDGSMGYSLMGAGAGMLSGESKGDAWGKGFQGFMSGAKMDMERRKQLVRKQATEAARNPDGSIDFQKLSSALMQVDPEGAMTAARLAEQKAERADANKHRDRSFGLDREKFEWQKNAGTEDIREFEYARKQGFGGTLEQWMQRKRSGAGEYSLNPVYGTDEQGNTVLLQTGKSGDAIRTKLPDGVKVSTGVDKVDLGTHWGLMDKRTGNMINTVPKDIIGKEVAEERGKAQGQAQVNLPAALQKAEQALATIDQIRSHPGREFGTGATGLLPAVPGTQTKDFVALVDQAKGRAFLEAFESLKGGGAITEVEGLKAEQAIARLERTQSEAGFLKALKDLEDVIKAGMHRARIRAGAAGGANLPDPLGIR